MTELDARRVLLLRAFEQPLAPPWSAADADVVTRAAARQLGEQAEAATFTAVRAGLGIALLGQRLPAVGAALAATAAPRRAGVALVGLAALAGAAADAVGAAGRVNILAPPLFALLLWNLAVFAALALAALRRRPSAAAGAWRRTLSAWLCSATSRIALPADAAARSPLARFAADWWQRSEALQFARIATVLHAAAAAFAAAAIASLYVRGLGFEYRAGWDSTFLSPTAVHRLLAWLFAPALALTDGTLPDVAALARLRFSAGPGENAAGWIHLQALTIGLLVVLPRALLAALALRRARREARAFALPLDAADTARLLRTRGGGTTLAIDVLPYSHRLPPAALPALQAALEGLLGGRVVLRLADSAALGAEDEVTAPLPAALPLFALAATPERETHAAFVAAHGSRQVLVDESGFGKRFGAVRLAERRDAWRRRLADVGAEPLFVDLTPRP